MLVTNLMADFKSETLTSYSSLVVTIALHRLVSKMACEYDTRTDGLTTHIELCPILAGWLIAQHFRYSCKTCGINSTFILD